MYVEDAFRDTPHKKGVQKPNTSTAKFKEGSLQGAEDINKEMERRTSEVCFRIN